MSKESRCLPQKSLNHKSPQLHAYQRHSSAQKHSDSHPLTLNCLRKCSQWSVMIKVNNRKVAKIPHSAIALR